jgi:hypothetical protein
MGNYLLTTCSRPSCLCCKSRWSPLAHTHPRKTEKLRSPLNLLDSRLNVSYMEHKWIPHYGVLLSHMPFFFLMFGLVMPILVAPLMKCSTNMHLIYQWPFFASPLHVKNRRASRHRPDSNTLLGAFVGFQGTAHIYQYIGDSGRVQYAHHAFVDELCVHRLPSDRSPAAKALLNHSAVDASISTHTAALKTAISDLIPSCSPWLNHDMSVTEISRSITR